MIKIGDVFAYKHILKRMANNCMIDCSLEEDIIHYMKQENHENWFSKDNDCFMCITHLEDKVVVPYTWRANTFKAHRELAMFAKQLYKCYTIDKRIPIYYTGLKNLYPNHSIEVSENVWLLKMKD